MEVAYQGEPGAFSEQAARAFFGSGVQLRPFAAFDDVFVFAARVPRSAAIVPIENSTSGSILENYDLLLKHNLRIIGEIKLRIHLHFMALPGSKLRSMTSVYSHPQALKQCDQFLRKFKLRPVPHYDTAGSAKIIKEQRLRDVGALASRRAAQVYSLRILKRNVETQHRNYTRFLILSRTTRVKALDVSSSKSKTSLVFSVRNVPGALFKAIGVFALREINLLKIESRPLIRKPWEYLFYLDVEGSTREKKLLGAIDHLKELCTSVRVLGSYPQGRTVEA
ncbi:MAG TPA: prephenate dehydratase [Bacteroidota bacterium]|nr:prephenate dehydratase [Bacteroidota bacterium]